MSFWLISVGSTKAEIWDGLCKALPDVDKHKMQVIIHAKVLFTVLRKKFRREADLARFPIKSTLSELVNMIQDLVHRTDEELKVKLMDYNSIKSSLGACERKTQGSLNAASITPYVRKDDFVSSEKLNTVFCAVPKFAVNDFLNNYQTWGKFQTEKMGEINGVVPGSAKELASDSEYSLYRVVVFRMAEDEFKTEARNGRVTVRDFTYQDGQQRADEEELSKLKKEESQAKGKLERWSTTSFSECFRAWIHLKAIRVFVESVLRYGLPPNFQAMLIKPGRNEDRVRKTLNSTYAVLAAPGLEKALEDGPAQSRFYPYVDIEIKYTAMTD
ncbi:hypothetical protein GUITHDRAFT_109219 [Guillardia theta CCMP2712]|uniref:V-type proton ATPase subunit C n=1 Tax=Guillardia theta (strain CCMP2712) TaxID=905079 RepID=L1J8D2_GUITC|nr:hypothetical protein GUITHDRAFT_109219 [Guillardia theta CCMP2712]EKX44793.1 hypothetical protein GUITHDRAFT_109219 [Guillardia theta CCMP2712]|eukprot:XP_005831773.1 hypothetical protein GUITHDRAFT_109219 [Guillardia theta CCMP2712]